MSYSVVWNFPASLWISISVPRSGADYAATCYAATSLSLYSSFVVHLGVGGCFLPYSGSRAESLLVVLWSSHLPVCFNSYVGVEVVVEGLRFLE